MVWQLTLEELLEGIERRGLPEALSWLHPDQLVECWLFARCLLRYSGELRFLFRAIWVVCLLTVLIFQVILNFSPDFCSLFPLLYILVVWFTTRYLIEYRRRRSPKETPFFYDLTRARFQTLHHRHSRWFFKWLSTALWHSACHSWIGSHSALCSLHTNKPFRHHRHILGF